MGRRASLFSETDVRRAIRGVQAAGVPVGGVKISRDGTIHVLTTAPEPQPIDDGREYEL